MGDSTDAGVKMDFETWINKRRFKYSDFTYEQLSEAIRTTNAVVTVIIPGKEVADSIGGVLDVTVAPLVEAGIVKNVVVIDAASADGTGEVAAKHGARVVQRKDIATELGPSLGKGDALWRALQVTDGDIIAFLDGDTGDPNPAHLMGIIAPLILDQEIQMVRACFDRPFKGTNGETKPHEGGRVTEILARPLLNLYCPDLRGFRQPLAGEFAARRDLLEKFTFPVGYGIEIGTFIDAYTIMGLGALAEVDVGTRQNAHKPLRELPKMGMGILGAFDRRTTGGAHVDGSNLFLPWDNASVHIPTKERPTIKQYRTQIEQRANTMSEMEFSVFPSPPFVNIEGVRMFRDIGGNIIDSTHKVRSGLFYRSGQLEGMSAKGAEGFRKLGLKVIFDMRSPIEINTPSIHGTDGSEKRHDSGIEVSGLSLATLLLEPGAPEVVLVPAFPDEDWKQENKQERLKNYANAAEVSFYCSLGIWENANNIRVMLVPTSTPSSVVPQLTNRSCSIWLNLLQRLSLSIVPQARTVQGSLQCLFFS